MSYFLLLLGIFAGSLLPLQGGINSKLAKSLQSPFQSAFISFLVGTFALAVLLAFTPHRFPSFSNLKGVPFYYFAGGLLGTVYVSSSIILIPKIGAASLVFALLAGQMLSSLLIDQFGLFGLPVKPVTLTKTIGIILIFTGVWLLNKS